MTEYEEKYYISSLSFVVLDGLLTVYWMDKNMNLAQKEQRDSFTLKEVETITHGKLARDCGMDDMQELSLVGNIIGDYWANPMYKFERVK